MDELGTDRYPSNAVARDPLTDPRPGDARSMYLQSSTDDWLAARDAEHRRLGAAEVLEAVVLAVRGERPHEMFVPLSILEIKAARLREGK